MEVVLFFLVPFSPPRRGTEVTPGYCLKNPQPSAGSSSWGERIGACIHWRAGLCTSYQKEVVEDKPLLQSSASLTQAEVGMQCLHSSRLKRSLKRNKPLLGILWSLPQQCTGEPGCSAVLPSSPKNPKLRDSCVTASLLWDSALVVQKSHPALSQKERGIFPLSAPRVRDHNCAKRGYTELLRILLFVLNQKLAF